MQPNDTTVRVDAVIAGKRLRAPNPEAVDRLVESITLSGLLSRILITPDLELIDGLHRLEAFRKMGRVEIPCAYLVCSPEERLLREIDANLVREELTPLQRADQVTQRVELRAQIIEKERGSVRANVGLSDEKLQTEAAPYRSALAETAETLNVSERTVKRQGQISHGLTEEARTLLEESEVRGSQQDLEALAPLPGWRQVEVIRQAEAEGVSILKALGKPGKEGAIERPEPLPRGRAGCRPFATSGNEPATPHPQDSPAYRPFASDARPAEVSSAPQVRPGYRPFAGEVQPDQQAEVIEAPVVEKPKLPSVYKPSDQERVLATRNALTAATTCGCCCETCRERMKRALA